MAYGQQTAALSLSEKTGFRRKFPEDLINEELVERYNANPGKIGRLEMRNEVKWFRSALNRKLDLAPLAWELLLELIDLSHDCDWQGGPITVWPANEYLMERLDCSERALQYQMRALSRANLITHVDHSSRKRFGHRGLDGRIVMAFGIDLRPLAARADELVQMARQAREERKERGRLRRTLKVTIANLVEYVRTAASQNRPIADWQGLYDELQAVSRTIAVKRIPLDVLRAAKTVLDELDAKIRKLLVKALRPASPSSDKDTDHPAPEGASDCTLETTTTNPSSDEDTVRPPESGVAEPSVPKPATQSQAEKNGEGDSGYSHGVTPYSAFQHLEKYKITPELLVTACPSFCAGLNDEPDWDDLVAHCELYRSIYGLHPSAWRKMCETLGERPAAAGLAVIGEKFLRGARGGGNVIESPAGYCVWMTRQAKNRGFLDIGPKIHALLTKDNRPKKA
ncbi:MAG: hypothetical protein JJU26_13115 [Oceanicaulis sp.]|uniref:plasmid replication protein RepC n=1 Tax=Glycocaulis sp. TaxID=1969725 RepID=UPI0025BF579E|nr:plasmid replication protein RepC [Glycocaulis sp.]MCC5982646.1 hypothetical protein [Oceanicaulis sp.]MCH8522351.1 hypothetical protein [Glycocaulis sp.]